MRPHSMLLIVLLLGPFCDGTVADEVQGKCQIVISAEATEPEQIAAEELAKYLGKLYPKTGFEVCDVAARASQVVFLGTPKSVPHLTKYLGRHELATPESYAVTAATIDGRKCGLILGADPAGVAYGVYSLLEQLGCGFYLSFDALPEPKSEPFSFGAWKLSDHPLVPTRLVFNWHNFLSGCSTWNPEHWEKWIVQSQKMGYNSVMVHAYGNNPMAGFPLRGMQKPVGYLSSTRVGRDWSTNHVNDVRRLYGGQIFNSSVFGTNAAIEGTDHQRTTAAQRLMAEAFSCAQRRGVDVYFAVDVDTMSANPQELIRTLPERARFEVDVPAMAWMGQEAGSAWLVDPDSAEGFEFYKAQVAHLLGVYPQIDCLVVWHRKGGTPWMTFPVESIPKAWQAQYAGKIRRDPEVKDLWHSLHMFAQAKIVRAFQRALDELKRADVKLAFGSWEVRFLPAADRFMPEGVSLIPLDYLVLRDQSIFDTRERRAGVAAVGANRAVIPVAWAHHDDGNYVGPPYTPYSNFHDRLAEMGCETAGYGIIHWTTKPLDLYFKSLVDQVWARSRNEPLEVTCRAMARCLIGPEQAEAFGDYLHAWVTTMPKIGRETGDFFIDHALKDLADVEAHQRTRLDMLAAVDRSKIPPSGREWLDYFAGLERYVLDVYRTEDTYRLAKKQYAAGDLEAARTTMDACRPENVIERYAEFSQRGGLTRGERGLVVTMNTRWLPHYVQFRQMLALEPVRYNFAPTSHDPLAQSRGIFTFHFGPDQTVWQCFGTEETNAKAFAVSADMRIENSNEVDAVFPEIFRTGIESDDPMTLTIRPILAKGSRKGPGAAPLAPGKYRLTLLMLDWTASSEGQRVFDVSISVGGEKRASNKNVRPDRVDIFQRVGGPNRGLALSYPIALVEPAAIDVTLAPVKGRAVICGVVLEPLNDRGKDVD